MVKEFATRRNAMVDGLNAIDGISVIKPQGAFYVFANVSGLFGRSFKGKTIKGSVDLATYLIDEAGIAVVPGEPFGDDKFIRLSYATSMDNITKGLKRIGEAAGALK